VGARAADPLESGAIVELLRAGPVQFVVADVGHALLWVPPRECFAFWVCEARPHLLAGADDAVLSGARNSGYTYVARRWDGALSHPVVVLETYRAG
jgi:hypothetical protein